MRKFKLSAMIIALILIIIGCGNIFIPLPEITLIPVTRMMLKKTSAIILVGNSEKLHVNFTPVNSSNKGILWTSSNSSIAEVDFLGNVKANDEGTCTITAESQDGNYISKCYITTKNIAVDITNINVEGDTQITIGTTRSLSAYITPSNATNKNLTWASNDYTTVSVDSSGLVTGLKLGSAIITVTTEDGVFADVCIVTVIDVIPVTGVTIDVNGLAEVNSSYSPTITFAPLNATNKNYTLSSSDSSIVQIDYFAPHYSAMMPKNPGTCTIEITSEDGNLKDTFDLIVGGDSTPPFSYSNRFNSSQEIILFFNEELEEISAETIGNFTISAGSTKTVTTSHLLTDKKSLLLTLSAPLSEDEAFTLTYLGIKDLENNPNTSGESLFRYVTPPLPLDINKIEIIGKKIKGLADVRISNTWVDSGSGFEPTHRVAAIISNEEFYGQTVIGQSFLNLDGSFDTLLDLNNQETIFESGVYDLHIYDTGSINGLSEKITITIP